MKKMFLTVIALSSASVALAGTPTMSKNQALGFTMTAYVETANNGADLEICDVKNECVSFKRVANGKTEETYRELKGKCEMTLEAFSKSFRKGTTKNEFMLELSAFIIKVIKGEENCKLTQSGLGTSRSLTGIYIP